MCYQAQKIDACMIVLFKVGMIMLVEFRPIYFSISPTQTFLGLHHTLTVLPHDCWGGLHYEPKERLLGRPYSTHRQLLLGKKQEPQDQSTVK